MAALFELIVDTTAPTAIATVSQTAYIEPYSGLRVTATVTGTISAGEKVQISLDDGRTWNDAVSIGGDEYRYDVPDYPYMADARLIFQARVVDTAGNIGPATSHVFQDDPEPYPYGELAIFSCRDNVGSVDGYFRTGSSTDDRLPDLFGVATVEGDVRIYDGSTLLGTATRTNNGYWHYQIDKELSEGVHTFTAVVTDPYGKEWTAAPFSLTVDLTGPTNGNAVAITGYYDDVGMAMGAFKAGTATDDRRPELHGTVSGLQSGEVVRIYEGSMLLGTATVTGKTWSFKIGHDLIDGIHNFRAVISDSAGNNGTASTDFEVNVMVDTAKPNAPVISGDFFGTAEPNSHIRVYDKNGNFVGHTFADKGGSWSLELSQILGNGEHVLTVTSTDVAGIESDPTSPFTLVVDTTPPPAIDEGKLGLVDDIGPITGKIAKGGSTFDDSPSYSGDAGSVDPFKVVTINIYDHGKLIGSALVQPDGSWSFNPIVDPGMHVFQAAAVDAAGNEGAKTEGWVFVLVCNPVALGITFVMDDVGSNTGLLQREARTDDKTPTVSGTGMAGTTVIVYVNGVAHGSTEVAPDGSWSVTLDELTGEGLKNITAKATDGPDRVGPETTPFPIYFDTAKPEMPALEAVYDNVYSVTGHIPDGGITNDRKPTFSGSAERNSLIRIYDENGDVVGHTITDENGDWSLELSKDLAEGAHNFTVTSTDVAGNESNPTLPFTLTVDSTLPNPIIYLSKLDLLDDVGPVTGTIAKGGLTDDNRPTFSGSAGIVNPDEVVTINIYDNGKLIGSAAVRPDGSWSFEPEQPLAPGQHNFQAAMVDAAGNLGPLTDVWPFSIVGDTDFCAQPAITLVMDDQGSKTGLLQKDARTDDKTPTVSGTCAAGTTVTVYVNGVPSGSAKVAEDGTWSVTLDGLSGDGLKNITAKARDDAGKESLETGTYPIYLDTSTPAKPSVPTAIDDVGNKTGPIVNGSATDDTTPTLSGKGEAGALVEIYENGEKIGETTVEQDGDWTWRLTPPLHQGNHSLTVTLTDEAGNKSNPSDHLAITVDSTSDLIMIVKAIDDDGTITGGLADGSSTDDTTPTLVGIGVAGLTVAIYDETNAVVGSALVDTSGNWSAELTQQDTGTHTYKAVVENAAGTTSEAVFTLTIDTAAPNVPDVSQDPDANTARDPNIAVAEEYEEARAKGTVEALELFIVRHPDHPLAEQARAYLKEGDVSQDPDANTARDPNIAVAEEYEVARAKGTVEALELFIVRHPDHPLAEQARAYLEERDVSQDPDANTVRDPNIAVAEEYEVARAVELPKDLGEGEHNLSGTSTDSAGNESNPTTPFSIVVHTFNLPQESGHETLLFELLAGDNTGGNGSKTVNGFTVGVYETIADADRIDLSSLLVDYVKDADGPAHYVDGVAKIDAGDNIADYLKVTQRDGNTIISIDRDGSAANFAMTELVTLNRVSTDLETLLANHQIVI